MTDKLREALEREQFEKWAATQPRHEGVSMRYLTLNNAYVDYELHGAWLAWQARAALAAPVVEDAQTEVPPEVQLTPEEAAILKRALWKSVKVLAPAPTQPPTQLDTDSDDAKGLAAPPGYWHGHNAAQDVLASVMETELATYRAEVVALIGRGAALEAEVERLRIALATVTTRPPAVEAEPVPGQAPGGNKLLRQFLAEAKAAGVERLSIPVGQVAAGEITAADLRRMLRSLKHEDYPGDLWEITTVREKSLMLKVLRAYASARMAAAPKGPAPDGKP